MLATLEELKAYMKIDHDDDDAFLLQMLNITENYIDECVGERYKKNPKGTSLATMLQYKICNDLYENRGTVRKEDAKGYIRQDNITLTILDALSNMGDENA